MKSEVVLIHGMWSTDQTLTAIHAQLESWGYVCHSPLLPHHANGGDAVRVATMSHLDYVAFLKDYIATLNLAQPPILVGHSMGGLLVQMLAAQIPVAAAVLWAPAVPAGINGFSLNAVKSTSHFLKWGFWKRATMYPTQEKANFALFNRLPAAQQQTLFRQLVPESGRALLEVGFWWADSRKATRVDTARVTCPMLILTGDDDHITILDAIAQLPKKYPQAQLNVYKTHGHWLFDEPGSEIIYADMKKWLTALSATI
jgi:pimeloyl-ACP methyl ester carboxylesterase